LLDEEIAFDAEEAGLPVPFLDVFPTVDFSAELRSLASNLSARIVREPCAWPLPADAARERISHRSRTSLE
jgi:hypothetical protein